ncbi:MAG: class I SAM-dependent methyltransferase [Verrucomicrobia bacterium]|nr:class I SAM-dependent methyltransferase [Verrucomicrobiota bacterium]
MTDCRWNIYQDLHNQLNTEEASNRFSAECILDILWDYMQPSSVLDVGCGIGTWLAALQSRNVKDVYGIDGPWLNPGNLTCDRSLVQVCDLEAGFNLGRRFDLVVCLEVAEHLSPNAAEHFVESLTKHSAAILFSAAIPFQGGHHHVNEQFLPYWIERFARHCFQPLDIIRGRIWDDSRIPWWLRQNIVLFAHKELIGRSERLSAALAAYSRPTSIVHPDVYLSRLQGLQNQIHQFQQIAAFLRTGGTFRTKVRSDGRIDVTKIAEK